MWTINLEPEAPRTRLVLSPCPYCQEQFGTASLPIHVKRCRALYVAPTPEVPEVVQAKSRSIPSLQAMCTQMILGNLHITCFSGLFTQPAHQAALIASLPETVLQQILMHIVYEHQNRTKRYEKHKAKLRLVKDNCAALEATCAQVHGLRKEVDRLQRVIEARDAQHAKTRTATSELRAEVQRLQQENARVAKINQQQQVQLQLCESLAKGVSEATDDDEYGERSRETSSAANDRKSAGRQATAASVGLGHSVPELAAIPLRQRP